MFWKVYFWILLVITVLYHVTLGFPRVWEVINLVFNAIAIIGVFGFSWERPIFRRTFWKIFTPVFVVWLIFGNFILPESQKLSEINPPEWYQAIDLVFSLTLTLLLLLALFLYSFRNSDLWE
jgi:hypothetical protein